MSTHVASECEQLPGEVQPSEAAQLINNVETRLIREKVAAYVHNCIPCIAVYWGLAVQPFTKDLEHLRVATFLFGMLSFSMVMSVKIASWNIQATNLANNLRLAEGWCLVARLLMHAVCIAYDGDHTHLFLKVISMWFLPLSAAKETTTLGSFRIYLMCHTILVLIRFWGNWVHGPSWVFGTIIVATMLLDLVHSKHSGYKSREELARVNVKLKHMAEVTTKKLFERFCDATALLNTDLCICEPAPRLAALLGISVPSTNGRLFSTLVDSEDLETFHSHMELARAQVDGCHEIEGCETSVKLKLLDAYAKPVSVHLIHASFSHLVRGPVYVVGMSETWQPPRRKERKESKEAWQGTPAAASVVSLVDLPTEPSTAAWRVAPASGSHHANEAFLLGQTSSSASEPAVFRRRTYSPRPNVRTSSPRPNGKIFS